MPTPQVLARIIYHNHIMKPCMVVVIGYTDQMIMVMRLKCMSIVMHAASTVLRHNKKMLQMAIEACAQ